ncbi:plectin [Actinomadura craniellae]|uniref:Plectin n=1 Tax=Actinomadura craniellae TaxID=2231787 RepID=A0A365GWA5_9ACTN|nr:plectin [Actinomadura craniellae]RAY11099.1 plectin [Actinomadura craniellae]
MPLGRRTSKDVEERIAADRELAAAYRDRLAAATAAEDALRSAQRESRPAAELTELSLGFDRALRAALLAAEAAERVAIGPAGYEPADPRADTARRRAEIARRKAKARSEVRPWTDEVDRLRTARETHLLSFRAARGAVA